MPEIKLDSCKYCSHTEANHNIRDSGVVGKHEYTVPTKEQVRLRKQALAFKTTQRKSK